MPRTLRYYPILLLLLYNTTSKAQTYTNLVLKGGGIRGIAYTGALKVLEDHKITDSIQQVAGTSVGSIVGSLLSVGYTADEITDIMFHLKIKEFNDGHWFFIGGQHRVRKDFGWYRGDVLQKWLGKLIAKKAGNAQLTFTELHTLHLKNSKYKDLYVTATNITQQKMEVFDYKSYPDMPIVTAVRMSSSVPLYYTAMMLDSTGKVVKHLDKNGHYNIFVDGGLLANYPLNLFDTNRVNKHTLGLNLERPEQIKYYDRSKPEIAPYKNINTFRQYVAALYNLTIETLNNDIPLEKQKFRTIYISTDNLSPRVRKISMDKKMLLYNNGKQAAEKFLKQKAELP